MIHRFLFPGGTNRTRPEAPRQRRGRRLLAAFAAALPVVLGFQLATSLMPVHAVDATGQFAMDGTIGSSSPTTTPPFHWNDLFNASGNPILAHSAYPALLDSTFIPDYATPDNTYFVPTKDLSPIANGGWSCSPQTTPTAKDDIQNTYGAVFRIPNNAPENAGHYVAYLGVERLSNNGDSFAGFWLLKDPAVSCSGSNHFGGHHTDGDILILTNFTNGGGTASVTVYRWTGTDAAGAPVLVTSGNVCGTSPGGVNGESVCAISNASTISSPWTPTSHDANEFTEAAIDLTGLFGGTASGPCFSNFMAETRSSQQITATLKDFAGGVLDTCIAPTVNTSASGNGHSNLPGSAQHDTATMSVPAGDPTPTGNITFYLCDPAQTTAAGCPSGNGTQVGLPVALSAGSATSTPDVTGTTAPNDLATGTYCWGAQYTPDTNSQDTYLASYGTDATNECFTVAKASPGLTTVAAFSSGSGDLSSHPALSDTATLSGAGTGPLGQPAGETVNFSLFGPYAPGVTPTCATGTNEPVFTTTGTLAASGGNYVATTASTYSPTTTGTYVWTASYASDAYNNSASEGCNAANESATITTPQLHITKTADNATVSAGSQIGFTVTVSNDAAASGSATGVTISDPLPGGTGIHWSIASQDASACTVNSTAPQTLSCTIASLAPGASYAVHVTSATTASSCAVYNNTATAAAGNQTGPNVTASASTTVQCPNVSVTKTADHATVNAGDSMGFTVTVSNSGAAGTGTATNVTVSDPLPAGTGVDWSITSGSSDCAISGSVGSQVLSCTIPSLAPGASYAVHITSATQYASCTAYNNLASVSVGNENGGPFTASARITVDCPGLQITKTADATPVSTGTSIGFTVTVSNSGPGTADNVNVNDPLPAGNGVSWSISPAYTGQGTCSVTGSAGNQTLTCSLGDMASGASASVHVASLTTANSAGTYPNTATASSSNAPSVHDSATIVVLAPAVTITKTADNAVVDAGQSIGFTVTISNASGETTGTASSVTITDPLPMGTGIAWTIDHQWSNRCMITATDGGNPGQELDCLAFDLAPGASHTVHVITTTAYESCAVYDNTAQAVVPNQANSPLTSNATTTVQCPDLGITKTADATPVSTGSSIGFTVTVSNGGPGTATGVTVDDPLPAGTGITWSIDTQDGTACSIITTASGQDLNCTLGDMAANASYTVHITSATTADSAGTYANTATVSSTNAPTQDASAAIVVQPPAPTITKTADSDNVAGGSSIGFTVAVSNSSAAGTGTAMAVTINDPLPAQTGVNWSISPAYSGPGTCAIAGAVGTQTLTCTFGDMSAGATASVHITSATTSSTCSTVNNTATMSSTNAASRQASAAITMACASVLGVSVSVPVTGLGALMVPAPAVALIASGIMLIMGVVVRRRRTRE